MTDSLPIALYLEDQYPDTPKLFPEGTRALQAAWLQTHNLLGTMFTLLIGDIYGQCSERGKVYFLETRKKWFNIESIEQVVAKGDERVAKLKEVEGVLAKIGKWIDANGEDATFVLGDGTTPSYADVDVASLLMLAKKASGTESDLWKTIANAENGRWVRYLAAFDKYMEVV